MSPKKKKTGTRGVLVTGATGYIGSLTVKALAENRQDVERIVAVDIREPSSENRVPDVTYLSMDVRSYGLAQVLTDHEIDTVRAANRPTRPEGPLVEPTLVPAAAKGAAVAVTAF